jgi:hypothetical protein
MKAVLDHFGIDEKFSHPVQKPKFYNKIKDNIPLIANYNQMADVLYLPETKQKFKYLLVVVDLASDLFDIEPMKEKSSEDTRKALESIYKRKILKEPKGSMATDGGTEFKGVFHKYLYHKNIFHKQGIPYRHSQQSVVENLNKQITRVLFGYMNKKELETKKSFHEWTDILNDVRKMMNFYRHNIDLPKNIYTYEYPTFNPLPPNKKPTPVKDKNITTDINKAFEIDKIKELSKSKSKSKKDTNDNKKDEKFEEPKYKVGDRVYVKLEVPYNVLGHKENTTNFRIGDVRWSKQVHLITKILYFNSPPWYRYIVNGIPNCSYSQYELMPARKQKEATYIFRKIIGHKKVNGERFYKIAWKGYTNKDATYEPEARLIEDDLTDEINQYKQQKNLLNW